MSLPYYVKKRVSDIVISVVMLAFLFLTLLPIGWMIYSSLKDSTDIAIGKIGLRRAGTDILEIVPQNGDLLVLTADGGVNLYRAADLKRLEHQSYKTAASAYVIEPDYIWLVSANNGLFCISRGDFKDYKRFALPFKDGEVELNKVTTMFIKKAGRNLYLALDYKNYNNVFRFDAEELKFMQTIRNGKKKYFPNAGILQGGEFPGVDGEVFARARSNGYLFLGSSSGKLYKYDLTKNKMVAEERMPRGHLLVRWRNYLDMWKNVNFGLYLKNSLIICGFTMLISMTLSTMAAYALSRFRFPGADLFSNAILATQMIPAIMYLIPLYIMFVKFTLMSGIPVKGTYLGIILIYSAFFTPFSIWILRGFFAAIPKELEEAALIDGCSRFQVFWYIALRLAVPGIIATGIYTFLTAWDELMFAWVLTNADTMTIPVGIRLFVGNYQNRFDLMMAAAVVATLPVVVLFFMLQRHIVRGLTAGAVKG